MTWYLKKTDRYFTQQQAADLKELFTQRMDYIEKAIIEARRLTETLMKGFPMEYAKKLELEQTASLVKELKDRDLEEIKSTINTKLSLSDYETKHEAILEKAGGWSKIEANIQGRIWGSVWIIGVVLLVANVLLHVFWKK